MQTTLIFTPTTPTASTAASTTTTAVGRGPRRAGAHLALAGLLTALALAAGALLRLELLTPSLDFIQARNFGVLLSLHGTLLFYFLALPLFPAVLGALRVPALLGRRDLLFPRLSALAFGLLAAGAACVVGGFICGGTEAGWMFDTALNGRFDLPGVVPAAGGVLLGALALVAVCVNVLATILTAPRGDRSGPLLSALLGLGFTGLVAGAPLICLLIAVLASALFGFTLFEAEQGGQPHLFPLLFRFFSSPAQNLLVLGALGAVLDVLARRAPARPGDARTYTMLFTAVAVAGALAWESPAAVSSLGPGAVVYHALLNGITCVAAGLLLAQGVALLRRAQQPLDAPALYAIGFLVIFAATLGTGFALALPGTRMALGRTLFATAHLHTLLLAVLGLAFLGALHTVWESLTGRTYREGPARAAALLILVGTPLAFGPLFLCGRAGLPFRANAYPAEFQLLQTLAGAGATVLLAGLALAIINLLTARRTTAAG